jgi:predicted ATPase
MKRKRKTIAALSARSGPFLRRVASIADKMDPSRYPFNVKTFSRGIDLEFRSNVTFFVGENGSEKSTLLEAIAECCGFNSEGGNRDHHFARALGNAPTWQRHFGSPGCRR